MIWARFCSVFGLVGFVDCCADIALCIVAHRGLIAFKFRQRAVGDKNIDEVSRAKKRLLLEGDAVSRLVRQWSHLLSLIDERYARMCMYLL